MGAGSSSPISENLLRRSVLPALVLLTGGLAYESAPHPALVLGVIVAGAAVLVAAFRPEITLGLFLASIPLEYGWELHGNQSLTVTKVAGGLCFLSFALFAARTGRRLRFDRSHLLVVLLLCIALASTTQAGSSGEALTATLRYLSWALLYFVLTQFVGETATLRLLVWSLVASAGAAGVWGCVNFLSGRTPLATLPYGQQNDYAFVLASVLFLAFWLTRREVGARRWIAATAAACILAGIALSLSRGAYLALAVAVAFFCVMHRRQAKVLAVLAVLAALVVVGFIAVNPGRVQEGFQQKQAVAQENVNSRLTLWRGAVDLAGSHPLLGIGPGNFGDYYFDITHNPVGTPPLLVAHETYLEVAAELGPLGLVVFLAFLGLILVRLNEAVRSGAGPPELAIFLRVSFLAICVGFLTVSEEFFAPVWLVAGLSTLVWLERPSASST
ncbi:MAG: hypothetical protein QOF18_2638 [Frankiaceae bacterium]|nr:hypothetical protein [Frankiaceae bacterium]